ncbi:multicopper oxidase, putative [Phytophthora infestans T30-4]|uniref:Multicopper oxidase, putative n=2 Tax=Phytophthora infestans TaxID=4787 RepID=D0NVT2_PHYIT|nr:multicopper oxidase, putative [Phytophthora infestans T30-4]EEY66763.1 multicopper oxidase, putative [Phytophthora infestans T30-4]KAF4147129.1 Multicopper oxidase [Phytophthora infestans]|eukprot:XP_002896828.1 multicopper oxidase, putative [Phytophthora infestans T30-4]
MGLARVTAVASALLALQIESSVADLVTYNWRVTSLTTDYDGVSIHSLGINDKPADQAVIDVELGQEVEVRVTNEIDEPTCLHWHGLKQLGTQEMDGTSEITQCHISPNATAVYRFMPDKAGTFWWHSHHMAQYAFGLRGPLIVHAPANQQQDWAKDIDGEYVVQMADLYHRPPQPTRMWDNILINNRGRYNCSAAYHHNFTQCTEDQHLSKFHFQAGNKYLLRLINMAALSPIVFSIDDHEFRVVAADGDHLQPSELINSIRLNTGQRYDIVVEAKASSDQHLIGSFWMRANGLHGLPWTRGTAAIAGEGYTYEGLAVISYETGNNADPTSLKQGNMTTVDEFDFLPLIPIALPEVASDRVVLQFKMQDGLGHFAIDGGEFHHFIHPEEPPLFSIASGMKTEQLPATANARKIESGKHIEVVLVNVKDEQHPFHMHTHSPWVVGRGVASIEQIQNKQLPPLKLLNPMTRDVYTVPPCTSDGNNGCLDAGYLVIRFTADNPGVWIFHCHIDWHLEAGLSMILVEGEEELQQRGVGAFSNTILSVCGSNSKFSPLNSTIHAL